MPAIIQSIQQVTITIPVSVASATYTLPTAVNTSNAAVFYNGRNTTYTGTSIQFVSVGLTLTNSTTVTATRGATVANTVTVMATVVEFVGSVVNSIQYGTVPISASTSGTTTLGTNVGANSFVMLSGATATGAVGLSAIEPTVSLSQGPPSVVTATINSSTTATVYFCVVDLTSTAIASVQQAAFSTAATGAATTFTATIASVTPANTILVYGGMHQGNGNWQSNSFNAVLTNATTVTFTRTGTSASVVSMLVTAVQFQSNVLTANAVQRNTTTIASASTSNTGAVTSVNTAYALCNYCGWRGGQTSLSSAVALTTVVLTNATTETSTLNTSGFANVSSWEVVEFLATAPLTPQGLAMLMP